jgi:peroxiredoxin
MALPVFPLLLLLFATTTLQGQSNDASAVMAALNDQIRSVPTGQFDVEYAFKSALGTDTTRGRLHLVYFAGAAGADQHAPYVAFSEGKLWQVFDGETAFAFDHENRKIWRKNVAEIGIREWNSGNTHKTFGLFAPVLDLEAAPFEPGDFDTVTINSYQKDGQNFLRVQAIDSFDNTVKLSPDDPDVGAVITTLDIAIPGFQLRHLSEWVHFTSAPQYSNQSLSPIVPLGKSAQMVHFFNPDSLQKAGYQQVDLDTVKAPPPKILIAEGALFPEFTLPDLDGQEFRSADVRTGILLLDFWYLSCAPCVKAMPGIEKLYQKYGQKGLTVLGINPADKKTATLKTFLQNKNIHYNSLLDTNYSLTNTLGIGAFPTLLLVDARTRKVLYASEGWSEQKIDKLSKIIENGLH